MRRPTNGEGNPVISLDIDGTLGDYHSHFLRFAEGYLGREMPPSSFMNPGLPLHKYMKVSKKSYRECKLAYRQGGMKRSMPVYPGADELTRILRRRGAEIWICTTRPWLRLDNIDPDTQVWLKRNKIQYDAVLYGEDKYQELARQVGHRVVLVVDDLPEMLAEAQKWIPHAPRLLRDQPYNRHVGYKTSLQVPTERPTRVWNTQEIMECALEVIEWWKEGKFNEGR